MPAETASDFEAIKEALVQEHTLRLDALRRKTEAQIAEMLSGKRFEVERQLEIIESEQGERFSAFVKNGKMRLRSRYREAFLKQVAALFASVGSLYHDRILRMKNDPGEYGDVLSALIAEGISLIGNDAVALVETGESCVLDGRVLPCRVREVSLERWGGCILESCDGSRIVDNTLKTRWERMYPEVIKALSREVRRIVSEYPEFVRELRLS